MNPDIQAQWVAALRSGEYKQGSGTLRNADDEFCCLGVLCDLAVKAGVDLPVTTPGQVTVHGVRYFYDGDENYLPRVVREWAGIDNNDPLIGGGDIIGRDTAASANDSGTPFSVIADLIEQGVQ